MGDWGVDTTFKPADSSVGFVPDDSWKSDNNNDTFVAAHDDHDGFAAAGDEPKVDSGCRFCGSLQHKARECEQAPTDFGRCFLCGGEGHSKKECPNKPPPLCKLCREPGHEMSECTVNRLWQAYNIDSDMSADAAWEALSKADAEKDLDDIKTAAFAYAKSFPELTVLDLEVALREGNMNTHIIAKEQTLAVTHTLVNFQGQPDQKFVATFQFSAKPRRARQDTGWPADAEENVERLKEAGFVMDSFVVVCRNCEEKGHTSKACPQEKREVERIKIECTNCGTVGSHRARDCTQPRKQPGKARECRNCGSTEHMAKDCDQPPPPRACRNCDSTEHISKDCPQPKDWSRVTCSNCGEKGHGKGRCPQPPKDVEDGGNGATGNGFDDAAAGGEFAATAATAATADNDGW